MRLAEAIKCERTTYRSARQAGDVEAAWLALERCHILTQSRLGPHLQTHCDMFAFAVSVKDANEIVGQALRLLLAPIGSLTGRLPAGNTGRANVSAFAAMPIPSELARILGGDEG